MATFLACVELSRYWQQHPRPTATASGSSMGDGGRGTRSLFQGHLSVAFWVLGVPRHFDESKTPSSITFCPFFLITGLPSVLISAVTKFVRCDRKFLSAKFEGKNRRAHPQGSDFSLGLVQFGFYILTISWSISVWPGILVDFCSG